LVDHLFLLRWRLGFILSDRPTKYFLKIHEFSQAYAGNKINLSLNHPKEGVQKQKIMSQVKSFQMCSSKGEPKLRNGEYWAIVTLCAVLSFMLLATQMSQI
jgi:hypothetical protein